MPKPIKRHTALQPISREHHHGLLLSWKIREGMKHEIAAERIKAYTDWFWENHLQAHFEFEESFIFPLLGIENGLIKQALDEHARLKELFSSADEIDINLNKIEKELTAHIRFEERILFNEVEKIASPEQMKRIEEEHSKPIIAEWKDEFWLRN
jgi:iron-sulfur cluster repair protein YtfE (RIC family)